MSNKLQFLFKGQGLSHNAKLAINEKAEVPLTLEPLFKSIGKSNGLGAASPSKWFRVTADVDADAKNPWDACHDLMKTGALEGIEFIEPDLQQKWPVDPHRPKGTPFAVTEGKPDPQNTDFPVGSEPLWFREPRFGQFDEALQITGDPGDGNRVRIAHLDTGFDPDHHTRPAHISEEDQRNFVNPDPKLRNDARDRSDGLWNNFSHGTGTISILAGAPAGNLSFGCAPYAEVIPIRVANRVVLFSNSAIAQAFDYVHSMCRTSAKQVHVITMSMGGLPSQACAEAINALYKVGVVVVTAAGNNYANLPTHYIVYPARFNRVIAACGAMANLEPYADLRFDLMAGNYGPDNKMKTAIAAYTPNVPWARYGEPDIVDLDGAGTSAATPQVAAAAALWIQKNRAAYNSYPEPWMRVEAVRKALFDSAAKDPEHATWFGNGRVCARSLLDVQPAGAAQLSKQPSDDALDAISKLLAGTPLAAAAPQASSALLALEAQQVAQAMGLEGHLEPGGAAVAKADIIGRLLEAKGISEALRNALEGLGRRPVAAVQKLPQPRYAPSQEPKEKTLSADLAINPQYPVPAARRLRVFAYDPTLATDPKMYGANEAILSVVWEKTLEPGPVGEYLEVVDVDPPAKCCYAPVDLNHPNILAECGLPPSESNPQFHQQMVYAVAMTTIDRFEKALGRTALWAPRIIRDPDPNGEDALTHLYIPRLRIYPHALCEENSYYSSDKMALLFGYFQARDAGTVGTGNTLPGSKVFCSVSHDVIAHETTHALLDGLHPRYQEPTNTDMFAFHEAFADIVALFQHFSMPEALLRQIKNTRGDMEQESLLGQLAVQFGEASGRHGALRSAIGRKNDKGQWEKSPVSRNDYAKARDIGEPHGLGAVLVSAVFSAFVTIYSGRSADLIRIASEGRGILPAGEISDDLATRLAHEATTVANQVLTMCIRALDYCPPTDLTLGEYLRAIITADRELVPDDTRGYRVAFISAFRDRGIFPAGVRHLSEDSLLWEPPPLESQTLKLTEDLLGNLKLRWNLNTDRRNAYDTSQMNAKMVSDWLKDPNGPGEQLIKAMGFEPPGKTTYEIGEETINGEVRPIVIAGELRPIEVHSVRPARRTAPDDSLHSMLVVGLTQTFRVENTPERYRGSCTVLIDLKDNQPKYFIRKSLRRGSGVKAQKFERDKIATWAAERRLRYAPPGTPGRNERFRLLHLCAEGSSINTGATGGLNDGEGVA